MLLTLIEVLLVNVILGFMKGVFKSKFITRFGSYDLIIGVSALAVCGAGYAFSFHQAMLLFGVIALVALNAFVHTLAVGLAFVIGGHKAFVNQENEIVVISPPDEKQE